MDLGCGKGFLLAELKALLPGLKAEGIDRSKYAVENAHPAVKDNIMCAKIQDIGDYDTDMFGLVISLGAFHNLTLRELAKALPEVERIGKQAYIMVESFRDEAEWFNLVCWCLTAETLMRPQDWEFAFKQFGYTGDYEFIYFT